MEKYIFTVGFSLRKRCLLRQYFPDSYIKPLKNNQTIPPNSAIIIWGSAPIPAHIQSTMRRLRVEDGFIRSIGLGSALATPYSWVFDFSGIYYDARQPSDLELLLENEKLSKELIERSEKLIALILRSGITKYNLQKKRRSSNAINLLREKISNSQSIDQPKKVILVIGQVESDASVRYGGIDTFTNHDLLAKVKALNPTAFIIYKPHPDETSRLRPPSKDIETAQAFWNHIEQSLTLLELLPLIDELHTISSLSGFEALLRKKRVVCYGVPFYAGWGLTSDQHQCTRRTRKLSLEELVAGALIRYPKYFHPSKKTEAEPEEMILAIIRASKHQNRLLSELKETSIRIFIRVKNMLSIKS